MLHLCTILPENTLPCRAFPTLELELELALVLEEVQEELRPAPEFTPLPRLSPFYDKYNKKCGRINRSMQRASYKVTRKQKNVSSVEP